MKWLGITFTWFPKKPEGSKFEAQEVFAFTEQWKLNEMGKWFFQNYPAFRGQEGRLSFNSYELETEDHETPV